MEKKKILAVDDDLEILEMLNSSLVSFGYDVTTASMGRTMRNMMAENKPDLIIMDVMLPDIDGITLCQEIRHNPDTKNIPVIMLTALSDGTTHHDALLFGAVDYLVKPFDIDELKKKIEKIFGVQSAG